MKATVFAPATVGNVGPGFDVLGMAVEGLGDKVTVELSGTPQLAVSITGRDAEDLPRNPTHNSASIAARAILKSRRERRHAKVSIVKGLPLAGGLGGSAASAIGGALATALALEGPIDLAEILQAAFEGESTVSGEHLDNLAPCLFGGLTLVRDVPTRDIVQLKVAKPYWITLVSPKHRVDTKNARAILPKVTARDQWVAQMANTGALVHAFAEGDSELLRRSLDDRFAEVARAPLIPHFAEVKAAALKQGVVGCSISGAGPTVFAISLTEAIATKAGAAMRKAFGPLGGEVHIGQIAKKGARRL